MEFYYKMPVLPISDIRTFNNLVSTSGKKLIIIDFSAKWCGPCKYIAPKYEQLSDDMPDIVFCKVDIDEAKDLAKNINVKIVPTFVFIKNGKIVPNATVQGINLNKIVENCKKLRN